MRKHLDHPNHLEAARKIDFFRASDFAQQNEPATMKIELIYRSTGKSIDAISLR
ncbi:hypothetical protein [Bradyrhizobium sp. STM 3562]|uniref:hypothetical protein n=1 Tax=Bradyrhizobium sp. STM 3562 TaxID=578924 RepID=UPI00388FE07D